MSLEVLREFGGVERIWITECIKELFPHGTIFGT